MAGQHIFLQLATVLISVDVVSLQGGAGIPLQAVSGMSMQGANGIPMQGGTGMPMQTGNSMTMQSGNGIAMQNGNGMNMQNGGGMTMQNGGGMTMQNGGGMTMQNGGGMTMQNGGGMTMQGGGSMSQGMQSGSGTQNEPILIQSLQMHPHAHMGMQMVPQNMHGMPQMSGVSVLQGGGSAWNLNRAVPSNMHMQGEAAMNMGNSQLVQVGGGATGGAGSPGVQTVSMTGGQGQPHVQNGMGSMGGQMSNIGGQMSNMATDMQQMSGQFWGHVPQQNQFGAFPYAGSMNAGDPSLGFNPLGTTSKPATETVTTAAPAAGKGGGSTPYPKITFLDKPKFKNGMINWKDVAESLVEIGKVLNWLMKFSYMQ